MNAEHAAALKEELYALTLQAAQLNVDTRAALSRYPDVLTQMQTSRVLSVMNYIESDVDVVREIAQTLPGRE